jgi:hypothetical protein
LRAIDEAEREVSSLPPELPDEPIDLQVKRASLYSTLVAPAEAGPRWARVALSPEASPAVREKAAGYLASHADVGLAARTIEELGRQGAPGVDVPLLRGVLAERLDDGDAPGM